MVEHLALFTALDAAPRLIVGAAAEAAVEVLSFSEEQAAEFASDNATALREELQKYIERVEAESGFSRVELNPSSPEYFQGTSFVAPIEEGTPTADAKRRRLASDDYAAFLASLDWREFEACCRGVLRILGSADPVLTRGASDQGIDFYGELKLENRLANHSVLPGIDSRLSVWLVGQAKKYDRSKVSTPELRELVGSVHLARARVSADSGEALRGFRPRYCDPIFYLFFTTGQISADGLRLLNESGVVAMDGTQLAIFLSDNLVGTVHGRFDETAAREWIASELDG